jgi:fatty-acyl-CoA synthase
MGVSMGVRDNWATLWEALAARQPDHVAVVLGDTQIRWRDLDDRASRLAAALAAQGVGHDGKVAQLMYNCPEYLESAYASFKLRASTVNVNYRYRAPEIVHVVGDSDAVALVFHGAFADVVDEVRRSLPSLRVLIQVDDGGHAPLLDGALAYDDVISQHEPAPPIARSGDDALMLYTGGTTGLPKGVVWSHAELFGAMATVGYMTMGIPVPETAAEVAAVAAQLTEEGKSPVNMTAPPLMHGTALFLAFSTFVMGGTVVLLAGRRFDAAELLRLVERERVTQLSIVGDAFGRPIVAELERAEEHGTPYDISSLGRIMSTGATLSAEIKRGLMSRAPNAMVLDLIGASEGGPYAMSMTMPGQQPADTAVFKATPTTVLFDDTTWERIEFGSGRVGVLASSGAMPRGYYKDPDKTASTFRVIDGVRYSVPGDYASIDADGTVHLLGRGSVCINTGGEKVYPEEVEVAARSHPAVEDCIAVAVPDERLGERVALVAALVPDRSADAAEIVAHVKSQIATFKAPRHVVFVERVERSPSGKADYRWARQIATATPPT